MVYRKAFLAAGSAIFLAGLLTMQPLVSPSQAQMFYGTVGPANGEPDGNGVPYYGFLDGGWQCLIIKNAISTTDHPVRLVGIVGKLHVSELPYNFAGRPVMYFT
jgi:hypothetical protein